MTDAVPPRANYVLTLLTLGYVLSLLDRSILPLLIQPLQRDLHISDVQFAMLHGLGFAILYSVMILPIGWLADRASRKNIISAGVAAWSMMTGLSGIARSFNQLFLARMGVGIGEAALQPAAYSMLADLFPRERLGRAIGIFSTGGVIGAGVAFIVGGSLLSWAGDRDNFVLPIIGETRLWQLIFLFLGAPGILLALLIVAIREPARHAAPLENAGLAAFGRFFAAHKRTLVLLTVANMVLLFGTTSFLAWVPAMLARKQHLPVGQIGIVMGLVQGLGFGPGFLLGGWLGDRWMSAGRIDAHVRVAILGASLAVPLLVVVTLVAAPIPVIVATILFFICMGLPVPPILAALQLITPPRQRAIMSSIFMLTANLIATGFAPLTVALLNEKLFGRPEAVDASLLIVGLVIVPLALLLYIAARRPYLRTIAMDSTL